MPGAIAVSGMGAMQPGVPLIRSLRAAHEPGPFIALSYDPLEPANYEPGIVDHSYLVPFPRLGSSALLDRLLRIHAACAIDVLVPTLDAELPSLIKLAPRLRAVGIRVVLPTTDQLERCSKVRVHELAEEAGIATPTTMIARDLQEAYTAAGAFRMPFVVKGRLHGAIVVSAGEDIDPAIRRVATLSGYPLIIQEYIPGVEYDVVALGDSIGELVGAVAMKKLQLDDQGKAWGGVTIADRELDETTRRIAETLRWPGLYEIELVRRAGDGALCLIEINPRVPAWIQLATAAGQNLAHGLVRIARGEEVPRFSGYTAGTMSLRQCIDVVCPVDVYAGLVTEGEAHRDRPTAAPIALPRVPGPAGSSRGAS